MYIDKGGALPLKVTTWDALGYYMYLPAEYIYHDEKALNWFPAIDSTYNLSGGTLYQAAKHTNGHYVFKYLKGVSVLQLPFFALAHLYASHSAYAADGFSLPYQAAIAFACLFYCILALFLLRIVLLKYFDDLTTAVSLFLLTIASNFIQYASVDSAQSHAFIFPLYVMLLYSTIRWHQLPKLSWAFLIGLITGIEVICRPTEAVMILIPLCWNIQTRELLLQKIHFLKRNYLHLVFAACGIIAGILPQLFYWKRVTGSWVYDVGSKWDFLNPHFRVLFGWEKGWFIYTPVTLLFVIGFFFMKKTAYRRPLLLFCLLNIYIIIAWHIWRYGGSYSCRALVQSYPVFAFPLACFVDHALKVKWSICYIGLFVYLSAVNLFQIKQYNANIIHYDENNFNYYNAIYLNPSPDALDMSLLDTDEMMPDESRYQAELVCHTENTGIVTIHDTLVSYPLPPCNWLKINATLRPEANAGDVFLTCRIMQDSVKEAKVRLIHAIASEGKSNEYAFFVRVPSFKNARADLFFRGNGAFRGYVQDIKLTVLK